MSIETLTLTAEQLDALPADALQAIVIVTSGLDDRATDAEHTAQWVESSEQMTWDFPCYVLRVGSRVVLWSLTDEAGVADVCVRDADDDLAQQVRDYAEEVASGLGKLVETQ